MCVPFIPASGYCSWFTKNIIKPSFEDKEMSTEFKVGEIYTCGDKEVWVDDIANPWVYGICDELHQEGGLGRWWRDTGECSAYNPPKLKFKLEPESSTELTTALRDLASAKRAVEDAEKRLKRLQK